MILVNLIKSQNKFFYFYSVISILHAVYQNSWPIQSMDILYFFVLFDFVLLRQRETWNCIVKEGGRIWKELGDSKEFNQNILYEKI